MRYILFAIACSLSTLLAGQPAPYEIDFTSPVANRHDMPFYLTAVVDRSLNDGIVGTAHTGGANKARDIRLRYGTEVALLRALRFNRTEPRGNRPAATLNLLLLTLSETILMAKETGRIDLAATLSVETEGGEMVHYGPASYSEVSGGLDVTGGHKKRLLEGLTSIMEQLAVAYTNGRTLSAPVPEYRPLIGPIPNGAYHSQLDFALGRIDTTIGLTPSSLRPIATYGKVSFSQAKMERAAGVSRRDLDELYGYHHEGRHYLQVKGRFFEVGRTPDGKVVGFLPRDLYRVMGEQQTRAAILGAAFGGAIGGVIAGAAGAGAEDGNALVLYQFDPRSAGFQPVIDSTEQTAASVAATNLAELDPIHFFYLAPEADATPDLIVTATGQTHRLRPGDHLSFTTATEVSYTVEGGGKTRTKTLQPPAKSGNPPEVYTVRLDGKRPAFDWASPAEAKDLLFRVRQ